MSAKQARAAKRRKAPFWLTLTAPDGLPGWWRGGDLLIYPGDRQLQVLRVIPSDGGRFRLQVVEAP